MKNSFVQKFGIAIAATTFLILFSASDVYTGHFLQGFDPFLLAFSCFIVASAFYHAAYFSRRREGYWEKIKKHFADVFWLNITTAVSWLGGFYAFRFIEVSIVGALNFAVSPVIIILMAFFLKPRRTVYFPEILSSVGIFAALSFLTWISVAGLSSVGQMPLPHAVAGISAALAAGIAIAGNTVFSKRLSDAGLSADFVLSSRFYLLILSAFSLWFVTGGPANEVAGSHWISVAGITLLGIIIPLYILQKVIECLEPITISFIILIRPVGAYLLEYFDPRLALSGHSLLGVLAIVVFIVLGILARKRRVAI